MSRTIQQIEHELRDLSDKKSALENELITVVTAAIHEVAQEKPIKRLGKRISVIRFSDMIGNPWNPEFYDWGAAAEIIFDKLKKHPPTEWKQRLIDFLEGKPDISAPVVFTKKHYGGGTSKEQKIPVSRKFIVKIIQKLS